MSNVLALDGVKLSAFDLPRVTLLNKLVMVMFKYLEAFDVVRGSIRVSVVALTLVVEELLDDGLFVVHPAQLAGHNWLHQSSLTEATVLPSVETDRVFVFLQRIKIL